MLDGAARKLIDPPLRQVARLLARTPLTANQVTVAGFLIGIAAVPFIAAGWYLTGLVLILANRILDGIDGAIAREKGVTGFGGFLDLVLDFLFYSGVPFGFLLAEPANAPWAAGLMLCFMGTAATFLGFAALAAARGITTERSGRKSLYYLGGLTEGTETVLFFVAFCLFPQFFPMLAALFIVMCLITIITRIYEAWAVFGRLDRSDLN